MQSVKGSIFKNTIPTYNDGYFQLFRIKQGDEKYPVEKLVDTKEEICFEELSITDKLRFAAEQREINLVGKIRIPQTKEIDSLCVLKIGNDYYSVYNIYHFTNDEGYKQSDITLKEYRGPINANN